MAWTDPNDWAADDPITSSLLNLHVRDNSNYLFQRPRDIVYLTSGLWTTTSTSFVAVDTAIFVVELDVTTGAGFEIGFSLTQKNATNAAWIYFDWYEKNQAFYLSDYPTFTGPGLADGLWKERTTDARERQETAVNLFEMDGSYTFELHWRVSAGTATVTATDVMGQLWMREI